MSAPQLTLIENDELNFYYDNPGAAVEELEYYRSLAKLLEARCPKEYQEADKDIKQALAELEKVRGY
jgi:hypothetical protein